MWEYCILGYNFRLSRLYRRPPVAGQFVACRPRIRCLIAQFTKRNSLPGALPEEGLRVLQIAMGIFGGPWASRSTPSNGASLQTSDLYHLKYVRVKDSAPVGHKKEVRVERASITAKVLAVPFDHTPASASTCTNECTKWKAKICTAGAALPPMRLAGKPP